MTSIKLGLSPTGYIAQIFNAQLDIQESSLKVSRRNLLEVKKSGIQSTEIALPPLELEMT